MYKSSRHKKKRDISTQEKHKKNESIKNTKYKKETAYIHTDGYVFIN